MTPLCDWDGWQYWFQHFVHGELLTIEGPFDDWLKAWQHLDTCALGITNPYATLHILRVDTLNARPSFQTQALIHFNR